MSEWNLILVLILRIFILFAFVMCYVLGGRTKKEFRRFLGGGILVGGVVLLSIIDHVFSWWLLLIAPLYIPCLCLGYGGDTFCEKFWRRSIYGACLGAVGLGIGIVTGMWMLGAYQMFLAVSVSLLLGLFNPTNAVNEEALIAMLSTAPVLFMV